MKTAQSKSIENLRSGWHLLCVLSTASLPATLGGAPVNDFTNGFSNKQITLTALAAKDRVLAAAIDVVTPIAGPTGAPTVQVKTGTGGVAITPTCACKTAIAAVTDNTVVGATTSTAAENLVLDCQAGGGDGAAATAGEIWVWVKIDRADRLQGQV